MYPRPMQRVDLSDRSGFFEVVAGTDRSQGASMILEPGQTTGGPTNRHERSDQWLYVVEGEGTAIVQGEEYALTSGDLVVIEPGEIHEIRNTGSRNLVTVNIYAPPEY